MVKIMTFCEGVTDPSRAFEVNKNEIYLIAPHSSSSPSSAIGLYSFRCKDCNEDHIRVAGKRLIEALVLSGVVPATMSPTEIPSPEDPLARDLIRLGLVALEDLASEDSRSEELIYL
jgi:hypothetical protein